MSTDFRWHTCVPVRIRNLSLNSFEATVEFASAGEQLNKLVWLDPLIGSVYEFARFVFVATYRVLLPVHNMRGEVRCRSP